MTTIGRLKSSITLLFCAVLNCGVAGKADAVNLVSLGFDQVGWESEARGHYLFVEDPRGLRQVFHPWDISADGDFALLRTEVTVPPDWNGPVFLNFYAADTYVADGWAEVKPGWTHTYAAYHHLPGHRFKQVLVDGEVVWERDVGDGEEEAYFSVDLSGQVKPGQRAEIGLRVIDKVGSGTRLPDDEFHLGIWSWEGQGDPLAEQKFYTRVFWGDVALSAGGALAWQENPARRWVKLQPLDFAAAAPAKKAHGSLRLDAPAGLPADGFPVTWGIPFERGRVFEADQVRLEGPDGKALPLQTAVLHRWPDNSIRWLLLDFQAPGGTAGKEFKVVYGTAVKRGKTMAGLAVEEDSTQVVVDTGALRLVVRRGTADLLASVHLDDTELAGPLSGEVVVRDGWERTRFVANSTEVEVEAAGPERATVALSGHLQAGDREFGRFSCRIHAYRGRAYLRVFFRIFNDTELPAQLVEEFLLRLQTKLGGATAHLGEYQLVTDVAETGRLLVRQHARDGFEVFEGNDQRRGKGTHWLGPIRLQGEGVGVSGQVRHFAQQHPKRMWAGHGGQLVFDLFSRTREYEQYVMSRGEAKRHELLLYFHRQKTPETDGVFAAFEAPPILLGPQWYAEQQAFGHGAALTVENFPRLHHWMVQRWTPSLVCQVPLGLRNWPDGYGDSIYSAYRGTWNNMYQELDYGAYILALLGGSRAFFDYAEAYQRHFMDLDICHYHPDPAYVGASYGIAPYHTGSEPYALNAPLAGLFMLHYLTGDRDARAAAVGIADWLHAKNTGMGASSGRAVGWPLRSAAIAYENTYDQKHLQVAQQLAGYGLAALEERMGFFSETPATWHYRGGISGMNAVLAAGLMRYWRVSGDERAAEACVNIAYNMAYSWMSPTEPGLILGADPLQHVYLVGYAMQDIVPLFWGYELTGDRALLEKGAQVMEASILDERQKGAAFGLVRYWEMQDILYYYGRYQAAKAPKGAKAKSK